MIASPPVGNAYSLGPKGMPPDPRLAVAMLALASVFGGMRVWGHVTEGVGLDFYQFWIVGRAARLERGIDPYSEAGRVAIPPVALAGARPSRVLATATAYRRTLDTYSSPLLYAAVGAVATADYERDHLVFEIVSMGALIAGVLLLSRAFGLGLVARLALLVFALEWNEPVFADARVGNVNRLQLALLGACFACGLPARGPRAAVLGLLLGVGMLFKPNFVLVPVWIALLLALRGRYRDLAIAAAGGLASAVVALAVSALGGFELTMWGRWVRAVAALPEGIIAFDLGNVSLARALSGLSGVDLVIPLLAALSLLGALAMRRGTGGSDEEGLVLAGAALASLLAARLVWVHYFVLALPAAAAGLRPLAPRASAWTAAGALGLFAVRPLFLVLGRVDVLLAAVLLNLGTLGLFAVTLKDLAARSPVSASDSGGTALEATA